MGVHIKSKLSFYHILHKEKDKISSEIISFNTDRFFILITKYIPVH